jgi:hypothetical protein
MKPGRKFGLHSITLTNNSYRKKRLSKNFRQPL